MATCWANSVLLLSHILGIGLESEGGHHPNGDLTVTKKTKRVKVCGTKIGPTMREYFFIHLHGRNPWGGGVNEGGIPRKWGIRACGTQASSHSSEHCTVHVASVKSRAPVQPQFANYQRAHTSLVNSLTIPWEGALLSVFLGSHHWCYQILTFMSLKNHAPCKPLNFPPCSAGDNGD